MRFARRRSHDHGRRVSQSTAHSPAPASANVVTDVRALRETFEAYSKDASKGHLDSLDKKVHQFHDKYEHLSAFCESSEDLVVNSAFLTLLQGQLKNSQTRELALTVIWLLCRHAENEATASSAGILGDVSAVLADGDAPLEAHAYACRALRNLVTNPVDKDKVMTQGTVQVLYELVNKYTGEADRDIEVFLVQALYLYHNFACVESEASTAFAIYLADLGVVKQIVKAMDTHKGSSLQTAACLSLASICLAEENETMVADSGAIPRILKCIDAHIAQVPVVNSALTALGNLTVAEAENAQKLVDRGAIPRLLCCMMEHSQNADILGAALHACSGIAVCESGASVMLAGGVLERAVTAVEVFQSRSAFVASFCELLSVVSGHPALAHKLPELGVCPILLSAVSESSETSLLSFAFVAMHYIAESQHDAKEGLLSGMAVSKVCDAVRRQQDLDSAIFGCFALQGLTGTCTDRKKEDVIGGGGVQLVLDLVTSHIDSSPFLVKALTLLNAVVFRCKDSDKLDDVILGTSAVELVVSAMITHSSDADVQGAGCTFLADVVTVESRKYMSLVANSNAIELPERIIASRAFEEDLDVLSAACTLVGALIRSNKVRQVCIERKFIEAMLRTRNETTDVEILRQFQDIFSYLARDEACLRVIKKAEKMKKKSRFSFLMLSCLGGGKTNP